ncbi:MAG: HAMP domain-containing histidine kinase [Eggerthellaceae bacterium]|nr:HAMP domain-containing histidine kinase [Eggerthellaceae bacterium]
MLRLKTYFSILVLVLTIGFGSLTALVLTSPLQLYAKIWIMLVISALILTLALIVGHFMVAPFKQLHQLALYAQKTNEPVVFSPENTLFEAHALAEDLEFFKNLAYTNSANLHIQQQRDTSFINDVAHELRTPLAAIQGSAEALLDEEMPYEMRQNFCNTIIRESKRLTRLTNDLITLQHIEGSTDLLHLKPVNVRNIANEVAQALQSLAAKRNGKIEVSGEALDVLGNPDRLNQALTNLVSNSLRFIPENGLVNIQIEGTPEVTTIIVSDNGSGFGNINPSMLFTRFFRGDNSRARNFEGAGLGLSIVKSIVENMDGNIIARNGKNGGAEFIIELPAIS